MKNAYVINGGIPLNGHIKLSGAKNVAVKALIAALLFDGEVVLHNIPRIGDVFELIGLLKDLGVQIDFINNTVRINAGGMNTNRAEEWSSSKIRTSFMLFAPLLHKFKEAFIPTPGGCKIGARSLDRIVDGMKALGIEVAYDGETGYYHAEMKQLPSGSYSFKKSSHTGTELMIILAVIAEDTIVIHNAALEPEIDDLIRFLTEGGARIERNGSSIKIEGVKKLKQAKPYTIVSDRIEAATYAVIAVATKGNITISEIDETLMKTFHNCLKAAGAGVENLGNGWRYFYKGMLSPVDIITGPHPGFMTDWQPPWAFLMTQANGEATIHERIYENRFAYINEFTKAGAVIEYITIPVSKPEEFYFFNYDPDKQYKQAIKITGPQALHGSTLKVEDLRAGATLAIAALATCGKSIINGVAMIERGYEDFEEKIRSIGGDIRKV
jgi:UDP-N-acetylglucosamine 1-carboxyvinyltransferase